MKKKSSKRRLFEVVGRLDKTFKLKLHENKQTLNERDWQYTINITQPWEAFEEDEDVAAFRVSILDILRKASDEVDAKFGEDVSYELETSVIDEFEMSGDVQDMDYALGELFDWADENNIWIEKMDASTPEPEPIQPQNVDNSQWMGMSMNEKGSEVEEDLDQPIEEFIPHGSYTVSNSGGYEIMLDDSGDAARVRDAFGSDNPETSDWLEIVYVSGKPVIDPEGYNIPLSHVMRIR